MNNETQKILAASALPAGFALVNRPVGEVWLHENNRDFVVFYETLKDMRKPCFFAYRARQPKEGRYPWTVDNLKAGEFRSLKEACAYLAKNAP